MVSSMSSEGRMSFSYVKQKSEDSPKVSVNFGDAEILILQTHTLLGIEPGCAVTIVHVSSFSPETVQQSSLHSL